jgi:hypothetical protein
MARTCPAMPLLATSSRHRSRQGERHIGHSDPSVFVHETNQQCWSSTAPMPEMAAPHSGLLHVTIRLTWMMIVPSQRGSRTSTGSSSIAPRVGRRAERLPRPDSALDPRAR